MFLRGTCQFLNPPFINLLNGIHILQLLTPYESCYRWRITENGPDEEINYDAGVTPSPDRAGSEHGGSPDRIDSEHGDSPDRAGSEHGGSPDRAGSEHGGTPDRAHHSGSPL